jgi:hypothetical protein
MEADLETAILEGQGSKTNFPTVVNVLKHDGYYI